ncbi:MAG: response regulator [Rhodospirillales bacterium]|nr:response regulator [Rhodospirillales bacterium]
MISVEQIPKEDSPLAKVRAVIHDTDRDWLKVLANQLKALGIKAVYEASTPKEALNFIQDMKIDILITHWDKALITFIRQNKKSPKQKLPIILLTSGLQQKMIYEARDIGIDELIAKPASAKMIFDHIEHALTHRRPFVRVATYIGPDRRRHQKEKLSGPDRRKVQNQEDPET